MGKHLDAVKPIDEFRAPWETEGGTDAEIDKPKLKRYIHNLAVDKAKAQDARDEKDGELTTAVADLEKAKTEAATANGPEAQKKIETLEAENAKLKGEKKAREEADAHETLRKDVIGDLDPKYAKYVVGTTQEELEKSLEAVKEDFGLEDGDPEDDPEDHVVSTRPRSKLRTPGDPAPKAGGELEYDPEKVADGILGNNIFG